MNNISRDIRAIIEQVQTKGDKALCDLARKFDRLSIKPHQIKVTSSEFNTAQGRVSEAFLKTIKKCAKNIERYALLEKSRLAKSWLSRRGSVQIGQLMRPVDSVGLYIPGGRYPYPSTVLMTAVPARVAGVKRIVMASPAKNLTPEVLTAARFAGIDEVYRVGGPGVIAAFAYGTSIIKKVDFIVGPGNQYVTEAKRQVFGDVGIDSLAGPSEVVILADHKTPIDYVLYDLQAQAEHDPEARSLLISTSIPLARQVKRRLSRVLRSRVEIRTVKSMTDAIEQANAIAPEHLEILVAKAERYLPLIRHASAIFLGPATPAALGDYVAGPSHVLPTNRAARFSSGLSVASFIKRSSVMGYSARPGERDDWEAALVMGQTEGMENHARSLRVRMSR